ncbi:sugar ABC transporter substrate-binding protein [Streptomyces sp. DSM 44915]|uniref:Sugar ABC transporter substrate-binding protein n=1 Tax=Streptomyces chisholmiae TaxID=3075540 RepID=A0ABU2JV17_9ACTN|nr:sugar ABC transporter substrate-binding protein [Streptomyces sp. DSM 44915]MDT0268588.1 sugar ABC transporter substrate-binding protein [Streptomyces sp. DSM 44915]
MKPQLRIRTPRAVATATTLAVALTLTSCSSGGDDASADGPVQLRMTTWSSNEEHQAVLQEIADAYVEAHPDLVSGVEFDAITDGTYVSAVTTQIAGGDTPDLMWITEAYAEEFVSSGVLADLRPVFVETEGYQVEDLLPAATELWRGEEGLYAYPFSNSPFGVYVNTDLLAAAGQPDPRELIADGAWTWDRLAEVASQTAQAEGVAGIQLSVDDPYALPNDAITPLGLAWGARPWSEDGTTCAYTSPESVAFFDWYHSQVYDHGTFPAIGETVDFASGQAAFRIGQLSLSAGLGDTFGWDFLPLPEGPAGTVPVMGQAGIGVLANGEHPDVAADFLAHFTNPENAAKLARFFPPPRESLLTTETLRAAAPTLTDEQLEDTLINPARSATTKVGHPRLSGMVDTIRASMDSLWTPEADVEAVLADVCSAIEPSLAE